jgi:Calpain family cysteine protease
MNLTTTVPPKSTFVTGGLPRPGFRPDNSLTNAMSDSWIVADQPTSPTYDIGLSGDLAPPNAGTSVGISPPPAAPVMLTASNASPTAATFSASLTQVLYLQEAGNAAAISVTDIYQGQMGDCYLLSSIGEIALFHPSWITKMIQANADGTETVTLYRAANGGLPGIGTASYTPVEINVTNTFPSNSVNNGANQDVYNGQKEIWVQVLEKAMATLYGGYNGIANGGIPAISLEELTGCSAIATSPGAISWQQVQADAAAGNLITFDTGGYGALSYHLYGCHAYMFQSLTTVNGTVMVNLLNP